jgi:hypothetical protein
VLFLAGALDPSWFVVLEALQNTDYVLTTRGTAPPGPASLNTGAAAGTLTKRGAVQAKGHAGAGQGQQIQQLRQQAAHLLLADVDPDSVQAAIQRLFDAG